MKNEPLKVLVHAEDPKPLLEILRSSHADVLTESCDTYGEMSSRLAQFQPDAVYSIRFAGSKNFPTADLLGDHGPRWISVGGSGVDHLGIWDTSKTTVTNSAGVAAQMMAEYAFGIFLNFSLDIDGLRNDQKNHHWLPRLMTPLTGKTLLIVGLGHTGSAVAKIAKSFGMTVLGTRANPQPTANVDEVHPSADLVNLYPRSNFIVVCTPLLDSTRDLLDEVAFTKMHKNTVLVDVSRGGVVQENSLIQALASGQLKGAGLDVFETEPLPEDNPLWKLSNVIISPHCSSVYKGWEKASMQLFCENLERWKLGTKLLNVIDPIRGY